MQAVVTGFIGSFPLGGVAWDYGQYALGLERLGLDVFYLEDCGRHSYDPRTGMYDDDPSFAVEYLGESLSRLSPTLGERWHFRDVHGRGHGIDTEVFADIVASSDILINVSGASILRDEYMACPRKAFIDTDPGWNHFVMFPYFDAHEKKTGRRSFRQHDFLFTYAERIGKSDCSLPELGAEWIPTRPPVVPDCWETEPPGERWTTVLSWANYSKGEADEVDRSVMPYGSKEVEFAKIDTLPSVVDVEFELALGGIDAPAWDLLKKGWSLVGSTRKTLTLDAYRHYLQSSRGEFSVAKNAYVETNSGWFSCRSACYLAAGRPVVLQDTGWSHSIPPGEGLLSFSDLGEAIADIEKVESDYDAHSEAARAVAAEYLSPERVLAEMLDRMGV